MKEKARNFVDASTVGSGRTAFFTPPATFGVPSSTRGFSLAKSSLSSFEDEKGEDEFFEPSDGDVDWHMVEKERESEHKEESKNSNRAISQLSLSLNYPQAKNSSNTSSFNTTSLSKPNQVIEEKYSTPAPFTPSTLRAPFAKNNSLIASESSPHLSIDREQEGSFDTSDDFGLLEGKEVDLTRLQQKNAHFTGYAAEAIVNKDGTITTRPSGRSRGISYSFLGDLPVDMKYAIREEQEHEISRSGSNYPSQFGRKNTISFSANTNEVGRLSRETPFMGSNADHTSILIPQDIVSREDEGYFKMNENESLNVVADLETFEIMNSLAKAELTTGEPEIVFKNSEMAKTRTKNGNYGLTDATFTLGRGVVSDTTIKRALALRLNIGLPAYSDEASSWATWFERHADFYYARDIILKEMCEHGKKRQTNFLSLANEANETNEQGHNTPLNIVVSPPDDKYAVSAVQTMKNSFSKKQKTGQTNPSDSPNFSQRLLKEQESYGTIVTDKNSNNTSSFRGLINHGDGFDSTTMPISSNSLNSPPLFLDSESETEGEIEDSSHGQSSQMKSYKASKRNIVPKSPISYPTSSYIPPSLNRNDDRPHLPSPSSQSFLSHDASSLTSSPSRTNRVTFTTSPTSTSTLSSSSPDLFLMNTTHKPYISWKVWAYRAIRCLMLPTWADYLALVLATLMYVICTSYHLVRAFTPQGEKPKEQPLFVWIGAATCLAIQGFICGLLWRISGKTMLAAILSTGFLFVGGHFIAVAGK